MNVVDASKSFEHKYSTRPFWKDVWSVGVSESRILVYTDNAKVWVDLPAKHEDFEVKMVVCSRPNPA